MSMGHTKRLKGPMWRVTGFKTIANNVKGRPYADLGILIF